VYLPYMDKACCPKYWWQNFHGLDSEMFY
jgi:hypothetical protein